MSKIEATLLEKLRADPEVQFNLIVRLKGESSQYLTQLEADGIQVRRTLRLLNAVAVRGSGAAALKLATEPWIISIEEDRQVHTMEGEK
jgi:hypothetical protein